MAARRPRSCCARPTPRRARRRRRRRPRRGWRSGAAAWAAPGRPDSAVTMGTLTMARAGLPAANNVATTASAMAGRMTAHGSAEAGMRWWALCSTWGRYTSQATRPSTKPARAPVTPTMTPLARMTRRTFLSVAPMASSIPMARRRRWASTVKPPTDTSAISSMPSVASVSTTVSGLSALPPRRAGASRNSDQAQRHRRWRRRAR